MRAEFRHKIIAICFVIIFICGFGCNTASLGVNNYVVNKEGATVSAPSIFEEQYTYQWNSLGQYLTNSKYTFITLKWTGVGGMVYLGKAFIERVVLARSQGKMILFKMTGNSYSMHSMAACFATLISNPTGSFLMFHSVGITKNGQDYRVDNKEEYWMFKECINRGILPSNAYALIQAGYEIYVYPGSNKIRIQKDYRPKANGVSVNDNHRLSN